MVPFQDSAWPIFMARSLISLTKLKVLVMTFSSWKNTVFEEAAVSQSQVNLNTNSVTSGKLFNI